MSLFIIFVGYFIALELMIVDLDLDELSVDLYYPSEAAHSTFQITMEVKGCNFNSEVHLHEMIDLCRRYTCVIYSTISVHL